MRKVEIFRVNYDREAQTQEREHLSFGWFHGFGIRSCEENKGILQDTYAIVELDDGTIADPDPDRIRFISPPEEEK